MSTFLVCLTAVTLNIVVVEWYMLCRKFTLHGFFVVVFLFLRNVRCCLTNQGLTSVNRLSSPGQYDLHQVAK